MSALTVRRFLLSSLKMETVLTHVAKRAYFDLPPEVAQEIIKDSGGNMRKAVLVLEALKMQSCVACVHRVGRVPSFHLADLTSLAL